MARANRKPTATPAPEHPAREPTIGGLCHEWRLMRAKLEYDVLRLPDKESDVLVAETGELTGDIEDKLARSTPATLDEVQEMLGVVLASLREKRLADTESEIAIVSTAHKGLNRLQRQFDPVGELRSDLEPKICDVAKQARAVDILIDKLMAVLMATKAIPQNDVETYLFATNQLRDMADNLKAFFYGG